MTISSITSKISSALNKAVILTILTLFLNTKCFAIEYNFIVQPIFKPGKTMQIYGPLVQYLNKETGHTFKIITAKSFLSYWEIMKRGEYDLILDAAHFTDYRIKTCNTP